MEGHASSWPKIIQSAWSNGRVLRPPSAKAATEVGLPVRLRRNLFRLRPRRLDFAVTRPPSPRLEDDRGYGGQAVLADSNFVEANCERAALLYSSQSWKRFLSLLYSLFANSVSEW